jgi:hypothetical protein
MTTTDSRLRAAFAEAERRGLLLTTRLRLAILAVLRVDRFLKRHELAPDARRNGFDAANNQSIEVTSSAIVPIDQRSALLWHPVKPAVGEPSR